MSDIETVSLEALLIRDMCGLCWLEVTFVITNGCLAFMLKLINCQIFQLPYVPQHNVERDGEAMVEGEQQLAGTGSTISQNMKLNADGGSHHITEQ